MCSSWMDIVGIVMMGIEAAQALRWGRAGFKSLDLKQEAQLSLNTMKQLCCVLSYATIANN